jgi:hypothetical protein
MLKALLKSPRYVLFTFLILSFVVPAQLSAQNPLFGPKKPRLFKSPDGLFSIQLPGKWQISDFRPGQSATFKPVGARVETQLMVQKINVPPGAHPGCSDSKRLRIVSVDFPALESLPRPMP